MQISFAARGVLNKLNEKFYNKNFLFAAFYNFDRGIDPYFKRRLSQVPMEERGKDWIAIMWSRDPHQLSLNNRMYALNLGITEGLYANTVDVRYVYCSIVFTYISNSMSYLEQCEKQFFRYVPDGFSTMFDNTPYKEWDANQEVKLNYKRMPRCYDGYIYECIQSGKTGGTEPIWSKSENVIDGSVIWKPLKPDQLKVQFDSVAYSGLEKLNLDAEDTLCKLDIGGRMFLPLILDDLDPETGGVASEEDHPRILYPKGEISLNDNFPDYHEYVTPTPNYWRNKLGF